MKSFYSSYGKFSRPMGYPPGETTTTVNSFERLHHGHGIKPPTSTPVAMNSARRSRKRLGCACMERVCALGWQVKIKEIKKKSREREREVEEKEKGDEFGRGGR